MVTADPNPFSMLSRLALLSGLVVFLAGLFFAVELVVRRLSKVASRFRTVWYSACFGGMVALFIARDVEIAPGIIIDPRGATVALAFVFGGPVAGWVTIALGILTRIIIGGGGTLSGVAGLLCTGAAIHALLPLKLVSWRPNFARIAQLLLYGSIAGIIDALSLLLLLDHGLSWMAVLENGLVTCVIQTLGSLGFGSILHLELRELNDWELHRSAIQASIDGFVLVRPDGKVHRVNPAMKYLTGKRTTELRSLHWDDLVREPHFVEIQTRLDLASGTQSISFETTWALPGSPTMVLEGCVTRAPQEFGGFFAYFHDVTASRRQQYEISQIYELVPDLLCLVSENNTFQRVNPAWQSTLGWSPQEMLGRKTYEFIHPDDWSTTMQVVQSVKSGLRAEHHVNRYRCRDGSYRWLEWSAVLLPGESVRLGVARDITDRKKVESELKRYQLLSDSASDIIIFIRPGDGHLIEANRAAVEAYGYPKEELLKRTLFDLRIEPRELVEARIERVGAEGHQFETIHRRRDGSIFPVEVSSRRGQIDGEELLFSVIRDISIRTKLKNQLIELNSTLEKRADEKAREARELYDRAPCGYHSLDVSGLVIEMNATELNWLGYEREEMIGRMNYGQFLDDPSRKVFEEGLSANADGATAFTKTLNLLCRDGSKNPVLLSTVIERGEGGRLIRSRSTLLDYTSQSKLEASILAAKAQADAANRAKSAFLANMSHELRTPLNAILGFSQLLVREEGLSSKAHQKLETIRRSGEHLLSMISEILELARIESGQLTVRLTLTNLSAELEEITLWFEERARNKGLGFKIDQTGMQEPWVILDGPKLRQIVINLLDNAIKFTDSGDIRLVLTSTEMASGKIQISGTVSDSGPGISESDQAHLFEPFFRGEIGLHRSGSTGLGLAISRQFARCLGGDLTVLSHLGHGSQFSFHVLGERGTVPAGEGLSASRVQKVQLPDKIIACQVLVADDEPPNRQLLRDILKPAGFEVLEVGNGRDALQICLASPPKLVLMDLRMPIMGGLEAIRQIRSQCDCAIPIIAVTAAAFKEDRVNALNAGADDFICKPFVIDQLLDSIVRLAGLSLQSAPNASPNARTEPDFALSPATQEHSSEPFPSDWLMQLEEFSAQADYRAVVDALRHFAGIEPDVRNHLTQLAEQFDFDGISQWVAKSRDDARGHGPKSSGIPSRL